VQQLKCNLSFIAGSAVQRVHISLRPTYFLTYLLYRKLLAQVQSQFHCRQYYTVWHVHISLTYLLTLHNIVCMVSQVTPHELLPTGLLLLPIMTVGNDEQCNNERSVR